MPHLTFATSADGPVLNVLIGLNDRDTAARYNTAQPIPRPVHCRAIIDTGADFSAVAQRVLQHLGVAKLYTSSTQTAGGSVNVDLFEVSLSISGPSGVAGPMLVRPNLLVTQLAVPLPNIEILIGMDVLSEALFIVDGPGKQFTLAF